MFTRNKIGDYTYGMRVRVGAQNSYVSATLTGRFGTVAGIDLHYEKVTVKLDDLINGRSARGVYYFKPQELEIINAMEENDMAINTTNITGYNQAIKIKFIDDVGGPCSCIYASFEPELKVGDLVVVKPAHHKIALARVDEILEGTDYETAREVVSKVYTDDYNERVKVRTQVAELKAKMQERARQLQDIALYQMLAKDDPAMQALLDEYQSLKK